jgi:hypothetical protein
LAIGPFEDVLRVPPPDDLRRVADVVLRRELVELPLFEVVRFDEPDRLELERPVVDEPFRLVDLFVLEPPLDELLLEDRVVCAIVFSPLSLTCLASVPAALFAPAVHSRLPDAVCFELRAVVFEPSDSGNFRNTD